MGVETGVPIVEEILGAGAFTCENGLVSVVACTDPCAGVPTDGALVGMLAEEGGGRLAA